MREEGLPGLVPVELAVPGLSPGGLSSQSHFRNSCWMSAKFREILEKSVHVA